MKIGIIGSGFEMMPLMKFLNKTNHEIHFFIDRAYWPWGEKSNKLRNERISRAIAYLDEKVDVIILPPQAELSDESKPLQATIMPLFETYLLEYVFKFSLIGKLGLLCEQAQLNDETQQLILNIAEKYTHTDSQKNTKKFQQPFACRKKNIRMWTYFLTTYGRREPMLRKTIKHDLRYFSDAGVDTLIPMSWGCIFYEKIIKQRTNRKKMRFHGLDAVEECFKKLVEETGNSYSITLHCTDTPTPLMEERKWMDVLSRGGEVEIDIQKIKKE